MQVLRIRMGSKGSGIVDVTEALYKKKKKTTTEIDECKEPIGVMIGLRQRAAESCMVFKYWSDTVIRFVLHEIDQKPPIQSQQREN